MSSSNKLQLLLKSFSDSNSKGSGKTDTNKLIQLSQFIEYLQQLSSKDVLSISKTLEDALINQIIPHPQVSNLVYRDLVSQICILNFKVNISKLRDFYISLQQLLQTNKSNSLRLTVLHVMGVLAANNPVLSQFLNDTCGILLKTAKSSQLSVRIAIVDTLKNCIIGAQQGIRYAINDLMRLCEKIARDRDSRVRVALSNVILLMSHYYPDNLKEYISLIRKQCTVKHHNVRHAFGDILGKILARTIPADIETAKREKRRRQQENDNSKSKNNANKGNQNDDDDDNSDRNSSKNKRDSTKSDDSSLAKSIIDFESGFFAALTLFDKLRNSTSGVGKNSAWFGLTAGTQLLMSFLKECMLLSRFEQPRLSYVIKQILKKLKSSSSSTSRVSDKKASIKNIGKIIVKGGKNIASAAAASSNDNLVGVDDINNGNNDNHNGSTNGNSNNNNIDDGIISCMSYILRFGLFKYLDESSQNKAINILCEFIRNDRTRNRSQIYLCLNEVGYILHSLQYGSCEQSQINDIFLMCLRYTTYTSHAIRNRAAQCLSLLSIANPDQVFVWADGLIKEISATLSTIDSSDPSKMYLLHGRSIALSLIIKIMPQLKHGVPDIVSSKAFSVAVDLFNVDIQEDVSFNLEASSILTVCGWILVDALIHLGTSWANNKIKTLLNIWRDVFSQTEFKPSTSSEAISLIYVKQAAYHSMLTFVRVFEKQIPIHPDLQQQIVKRLQHALDFEKYINTMIHDHHNKKQYESILTPAVRHQLSRLRAIMMNIFSFLPPTIYERHVTLLKLANANFSHRKAVTSNELEHLLDYEDDILCNTFESQDFMNNTLISRSCSELNIFIEYISNPTIDELGLDKSWMPQDLMHSILFQLGIIHDKNQINIHKSTRITSQLADINDKLQFDSNAPKQLQSISPHLSYIHYINKNGGDNITNDKQLNDIKLLQSMSIGGIMMNEDDIRMSLNPPIDHDNDDKKEKTKLTEKEIFNKAKQKYNRKILRVLEQAQMEQSMRLIPRLTMSYFQKENCDANLRLFCKLFPFQNEQHKLKLVQHFVEVAKDAKQSEKSESLKIVLQNSAAVILGCCKNMLENGIKFGKGKVRDSVLRIASDFLAFNNQLVMRAGAQIFGILSKIEDNAFKTTIIQYLYKKKFGEEKSNIRAASALALGCIHQYSSSKENLGFTVAALQLLERDGNVSLWLLHSLQKILHVVNIINPKQTKKNNNKDSRKKTSKADDDEAICRNILGFTLSILADEKDSVDPRVLNALLEILSILLSRIVNQRKQQQNSDNNTNLLNTIIFMLKFIERLNIPELHSKLLQCSSKIAQCSPQSIVNLETSENDKTSHGQKKSMSNNDALDAQQYIIHQLQRCLFSGNLREKVSAMEALQTFAKHSPTILVSKNILHSLLYLLDVNATVPIIYHRALSALTAVTSLYGQKYPQSLLQYFRAISLRGMQIKPPEISQIISLLGQDLAIKKITKSKTSDNEWVIIPPSLNCLRYTSLLYIQFVIKSMINYAINKGELYMDVRLAKKQLQIISNNSNKDDDVINNDIDYEFIILSISDLVQIICKEAISKYSIVRNKALECLHLVINNFSFLPDPDAGYDGEYLLNQFRAQIDAALRHIVSVESDPSIRFISSDISIDYMLSPLATQETIEKNFQFLFQIFNDNPGKHFRHLCGVYEPHVRTMIILKHLNAISKLYNRVFFDYKTMLKKNKKNKSKFKSSFIKLLKTLFEPKLFLLKGLIEKALMDYVVVTSSTRKTIRDYNGNFFVGHSYRRVRQIYISSFALFLRTLSRLISDNNNYKKEDNKNMVIEDNNIVITLFATSLYCLQDCLIHFDDNNQDKNELPLVQNACINLLKTLTSSHYLSQELINQDMLYDLVIMIHGGIKHQIIKNTQQFIWNNDLAQLLLNCTNTILKIDVDQEQNISKLLNVVINCWIDPINQIISYITTVYDDSPFGNNQNNNDGNIKDNKKVIINLDISFLTSLMKIIELINGYNILKLEEEEIDSKNWALQLTDWCNIITSISMLFTTSYKLCETSLNTKNKTLPFTKQHNTLCMKLLTLLLKFDLYTKPDPNNPNFNLNCMRARGCIAENINYLLHSLPTNNHSIGNIKEYYSNILSIVYQLAHCSMNVEITEERQDDDEKLNDKQSIECIENFRKFLLINIHNNLYQKYIIESLSSSWKNLLSLIKTSKKQEKLSNILQQKYSSISIQIETLIVILPHIIMVLSKNINKFNNQHFVLCLINILLIFDNLEIISKKYQNSKTCSQIYSVIIPLFIKYIIDNNDDNNDDNNQESKDLILEYISKNLQSQNVNLAATLRSLPMTTIVAKLKKYLEIYNSSNTKKKKKRKRQISYDDDDDDDDNNNNNGYDFDETKPNQKKENETNDKLENTNNDKNNNSNEMNKEIKKKKKRDKKKGKKKKKKKKERVIPQQEDENNTIDFGAF